MARSRRTRRAVGSVEQLVAELPGRFLEPNLGDSPLQALNTYVIELIGWIKDQGVRPESAQQAAIEVMETIGAAPSDWYRRTAEQRGT